MSESNVSIGSIELYVNDIEKSKLFYEAIGINLEKSYYSDWPTDVKAFEYVASFKDRESLFSLNYAQKNVVTNDKLWFYVDNVAEVIAKLLAIGASILRPRSRAYRFATLAYVKDPDGRTICLKQRGT